MGYDSLQTGANISADSFEFLNKRAGKNVTPYSRSGKVILRVSPLVFS